MNLTSLIDWLKTFVSLVQPHPAPKEIEVNNAPDIVATLTSIILSETREFGPSPKTGGHLHQIDAATAKHVATLIATHAPQHGLEPAFVAAGLCGESRFDPNAINPNWQDAKPGENATDAFLHTDLGIGQFDGATIYNYPEMKGLSIAAIQAKACDPEWAIPAFCTFVKKLLDNTAIEVSADPSLLANTANRDERILATEAYNAGLHGAAHIAHQRGDMSYGERWVQRYLSYDALLKGAK